MEPISDEAVGHQINTLFAGDFDLLLGRRTYDIFAAYWPFMPADNPIAQGFAKADKFVFTRSQIPLDWPTSHRLIDCDALAQVKQGDGPDLLIPGSSTLYPQLLARGLIDRLVLMIAPVTLGQGKRLFGEGTPAATMKLVEQRSGTGGWLLATYEVAGPVETGTMGPDLATPRELERRQRVQEGNW